MRALHEQLRDAWEKSELTLDELAEQAGMKQSQGSISRKLNGKQKLFTDEAEALARVLGVTLVWVPEGSAA